MSSWSESGHKHKIAEHFNTHGCSRMSRAEWCHSETANVWLPPCFWQLKSQTRQTWLPLLMSMLSGFLLKVLILFSNIAPQAQRRTVDSVPVVQPYRPNPPLGRASRQSPCLLQVEKFVQAMNQEYGDSSGAPPIKRYTLRSTSWPPKPGSL